MALHVIDTHQRKPSAIGKSLRLSDSDQKSPYQTRTKGYSNGVNIIERNSGIRERLPDNTIDVHDMVTRCQFRHDAAVNSMYRDLRRYDIRQDIPSVPDYRRCGLIA